MSGLPEDFAKWLLMFAKKRSWENFKIVQTQDSEKQLGIVCEPKQWLKVIEYFRSKGNIYPADYGDKFTTHCLNVLSDGEAVIRKPHLDKNEEEMLKELVDRANNVVIDEKELEQEVWQEQQLKKQQDEKPKKKIHKLITNAD